MSWAGPYSTSAGARERGSEPLRLLRQLAAALLDSLEGLVAGDRGQVFVIVPGGLAFVRGLHRSNLKAVGITGYQLKRSNYPAPRQREKLV